MKRFDHGVARRAALWGIAALTLAACESTGTALPAGNWTGDMLAPERPAAIGFLARVGASPASIEIVSLEAMGFPGGAVSDLRVSRDSMHFIWTKADGRACGLARDTTGLFEGDCVVQGDTPWRVRLLPPSHRLYPTGHAYSMLKAAGQFWESKIFPWGRLHIGASAPETTSVEARASGIHDAIARGAKMLGVAGYDRPLDAFLVADRAEIRALSGQTGASTADALGSTVLLGGYGGMPGVTRHEIMHVLSINIWGVPPEPAAWVREGIATYAAGDCRGYGFHQLAANFAASGQLLPLRTLLDEFYKHDDLVTYLESASVFQYIYETKGLAYARDVWHSGLEAVLKRNGATLDAFEAEWRAYIANPSLHPELVDWNRIRNGNGCG